MRSSQPLQNLASAIGRGKSAPDRIGNKRNGTSIDGFIALLFALFLILSGFHRTSLAQELDPRKDRRHPPAAGLYWENLSSELQHVSGQSAVYARDRKLSVVTLEPGQYVDFQVPAHELIRVDSCSAESIDADEVELWTSNGTGLFRQLKSARSTSAMSLIAAPDQPGISIGRILRAPDAGSALTVAVFTSARQSNRLLDYYQCPVITDQKQVEVSDDRGRRPRRYTALKSGRRYPLEINDRTRLRLETRLKYDSDSSQHQFYWVKVFLDGIEHKTLLFDTLPQRMHRQFVDGAERLIGGREFAYLDLDSENQSVEIEVSHSVFLRADAIGLKLVNPQVNYGVNSPAMEQVWLDEDAWLEQDFVGDGKTLDDYLKQGVNRPRAKVPPHWDPWLNYPRLMRVARDNTIRFGGLRAYMWMRAIAARRYGESDFGDELTVEELVTKIRSRFTHFRDLMPVDLHGSINPRTVAFPVRSIRRPSQASTETIVGQQHIEEAARGLATTTLHQISTGGGPFPLANPCTCKELTYRPSKDLGASLLRVIIDRQRLDGPVQLQVQYDDRPPFDLELIPESALGLSGLIPGRAEAAIASLGESHQRYDSGPWGGPYAALANPVAMIQAGVAEFLLPASVKQITISARSKTDPSVYVGVQCLVSGHVKLSELARNKHLRAANAAGPSGAADSFSKQQLKNDAIDLHRLRTGHAAQINQSIVPGLDMAPATDLWYQKQLEDARAKALVLAEKGNWIGVLETLSQIIHHTEGSDRNATIISRTQVLDYTGEFFLATQQRRAWLKFSSDQALKKEMLKQLLDSSPTAPASERAKEMLLAFASAEIDDDGATVEFCQQLVENGKFRFALLALPPTAAGAAIDELVLRCSFQLRWWKTFKEALKRTSIERRNYWGAMKALHLGQFKRAWRLLDAAGDEGQQWLRHWKYGDYIYSRLSSPEFLTRMSAIEDWESWLTKHPGPRIWSPQTGLVTEAQGAATLYLKQRDVRVDFARCDADSTSTIRVHGPGTLRLECRPLHKIHPTSLQLGDKIRVPVSGVIEVHGPGQLEHVPVLNNLPSDSIEIDGLEHHYQAGQSIVTELEIPAGLNEIKLSGQALSFLFRVYVSRPEVMSPVLPPITETTLAAIVLGKFGPQCIISDGETDQGDVGINSDSVRLVSREQRGQSIDHSFRRYQGGELDLETLQPYLDQQLGDIPSWQDRVYPTASPFRLTGQDEVGKQALDITLEHLAGNAVPPAIHIERIARLESLVQQHPNHRFLVKLRNWMRQGFTWTQFTEFDSRAGVYLEKQDSWRPLSPATRIRKTLLGNVLADRAVTGNTPLELDLSRVFAPEIEITLTRPRVSAMPTADTIVAWEIGGHQQTLTLTGHEQREKFRIKIDANADPSANRIRFWQPQPWSSHYVLVTLSEVLPDGSTAVSTTGRRRSSLIPATRSWHASTRDEPLKLRAAGPNLYRIDQMTDDQVTTRIVPVLEESRTFELLPEGDSRASHFRIFKMDVAQSTTPVYRPSSKPQSPAPAARADHGIQYSDGAQEVALVSYDSVNETPNWLNDSVDLVFDAVDQETQHGSTDTLNLLGLRSPDAQPVAVEVDDVSQPGVYDSGTTGFHFAYHQRRAYDEFPEVGIPERFFQIGLSNRKYDRWKNEYRQTDLLIRPRIGSGPAFGFNHQRSRKLGTVNRKNDASADKRGPWQFDWRAYAYGQYAGTPIKQPSSSFPWTAGFSGRIGRSHLISSRLSHHPSIEFFGRYISETRNGFEAPELDTNIFTFYKRNHRFGLRLSDQFVFQRYMDRRFYLRPTLNTNEDQLIPDNIGFAVGIDQLLGPVQLSLGYRMAGYLSDNDRTETAVQNIFRIDLKAEKWSPSGFRSEVDLSLVQEFSGGTSLGVSFSRYFGDGRQYRDFRPGSILFKPLKEERAAQSESRFGK